MPDDVSSFLVRSLADTPHILALDETSVLAMLYVVCLLMFWTAFWVQVLRIGLSLGRLSRATGILWLAAGLFITSALSTAMPLYVSVSVAAAWVSYRAGSLLALSYEFLACSDVPSKPKAWDRRSPRSRFANQFFLLAPFTIRGRQQVLRLVGTLTGTLVLLHISTVPSLHSRAFSVSFAEVVLVGGLLTLATRRGASAARPLLRRIYRRWCRHADRQAAFIGVRIRA